MVLTFHKLSGIFKAWVYGLLITTLAFIFEILMKPLSGFLKRARNRLSGDVVVRRDVE